MFSDESYAESWIDTDNGLTYELEKGDPNTAVVIGWDEKTKDITISSEITVNDVKYNVVEIRSTSDGSTFESPFTGKGIESVKIGSNIYIGSGAFYNCSSLKNVEISEGIDSIGNKAFYGCVMLSDVVLPKSVTTIGISTFESCSSLVNIDFSNVEIIKESAFKGCKTLESLNLSSVTNVGSSAFEDCTSLKTCVFGENFTTINGYAFKSTGIKEFNFPSVFNNKFNGSSPWWPDCTEAINISDSNPYLRSDDGVVYNKGMSTMYLLPPSKTGEYTVLANPTASALKQVSLDKLSFSDSVTRVISICTSINGSSVKEVILPNTVTSVSFPSFSYCDQLERVDLGGVTSIPKGSFKHCDNLKEVKMENVTTIDCAFYECPKLNLVLPESIKTFNIATTKNGSVCTEFNVNSITFPSKNVLKNLSIQNIVSYDSNLADFKDFKFTDYYAGYFANKTVNVLDCTKGHSYNMVKYVMDPSYYVLMIVPISLKVTHITYLDEDGNPFTSNNPSNPTLNPSWNGEPSYEIPDKEGYVGKWKEVSPDTYQLYYVLVHEASFVDESGNEIEKIKFNEEDGISLPSTPAKEGYVGMWEEVSSNKYQLCYSPILYTATFVDEAGNTVGKTEFTVRDKTLDEPEVPVKDGYDGSWTYEIKAGNMVVKPNYVASADEDDSDNGSNTIIYVAAVVVVVIIAAIAIAYIKRN